MRRGSNTPAAPLDRIRDTDLRVVAAELYLLPVRTRVPLKFGTETLTEVTCSRVRVAVEGRDGRRAVGWGETPLSVQWTWPSDISYQLRFDAMRALSCSLAEAWPRVEEFGHPLELGAAFLEHGLPQVLHQARHASGQPIPYLSALTCNSPFDIALHDAYGILHNVPTYHTYNRQFLGSNLARWLEPAAEGVTFDGRYPQEFFAASPPESLLAWHLVGGLDPLTPADLRGDEPRDGYPVILSDWITRDGLQCLKIKLRGNDAIWDYGRIVAVGEIAIEHGVSALTVDFNCTVHDVDYVNHILDRLQKEQPRVHDLILYVEQPFPYELAEHRLDVSSIARRKPLFMDESAHDWQHVRLGFQLGWNGVALKTCKTQTSAILMLCWARAHGMQLMVQDLTNPMLAQIPHVLLAAYADTIQGVETNAMQFYPDASRPEAAVHPGLYRRRSGRVNLASVRGAGFGYRIEEIDRPLPEPLAVHGRSP